MRRVIDGRVYDTAKAEPLHDWENMDDRGDFHYCSERLYRTAKGSYFLAGEGGAMTRYSMSTGNNSCTGGVGITAMSESEAVEWLEEHDGTEALLEYFPEMLEEA